MRFVWLVVSIVVLSIAPPAWAEAKKAGASAAETTLRKMHQYLIDADDLELTTKYNITDTATGSQSGTVHYVLRKPNKLRVTATGKEKLVLVSDGKMMIIHEANKRRYRELEARDSIIENLYVAAGLVGVEVRMIDFFWSVDYLAEVGGNARLATLPARQVGGKTCSGFDIRYNDDNWNVWLSQGDIPLPCRLVSKRKDGSALLTQTNTLTWKTNPAITDATFRFVAPQGHKKQ